MGLFQFVEVVYAQLFSIYVYCKVLKLFVYLLVLQFLRKEAVLLGVFNLIDLYQLLFLFPLVYLDGNAVYFLLIFLHFYYLVYFIAFLLLAALEVQIEIAFGLFVRVGFGDHVEAFFDPEDVGLFVEFQLLRIEFCQLFLILHQAHVYLYDLSLLLSVLLLCLSIGGESEWGLIYLLQLRLSMAFLSDCSLFWRLSSIYWIFCWIIFCFCNLRNSFSSSSSCLRLRPTYYFCFNFLCSIYCLRIFSSYFSRSHCFSLCTNYFFISAYSSLCSTWERILGMRGNILVDFQWDYLGFVFDYSIFYSFLIIQGSSSKNQESYCSPLLSTLPIPEVDSRLSSSSCLGGSTYYSLTTRG